MNFICKSLAIMSMVFMASNVIAQQSYVSTKNVTAAFTLATPGKVASLFASSSDFPGVIRAVKNLQTDIQAVMEQEPTLSFDKIPSTGEVVFVAKVHVYLAPTLNFHNKEGFKYGISFDDEPPQIVNMHADFSNRTWEKAVSENRLEKISTHQIKNPGQHTLKFWMVNPAVVLQKIVVETKELRSSYLGPPESFMTGQKTTSSDLLK